MSQCVEVHVVHLVEHNTWNQSSSDQWLYLLTQLLEWEKTMSLVVERT